ncbi:helix-turn-helix transcriptional regulator [Exilibacterium tricleocarpae]|uniref:Helix-turn-helix transcriptional regulator n=1 Tax=Exilibacterium tricleocarpae TaxID=2591008 RepID=A0A545U850_9GAMM|nr:helix-turn-helix domain-containing protein [Exilibacterium tricleocarpae]TQV85644.1 helix-turn-helix transcriptional regulator [Exilibacterium tricleocarpae]
MTEPRSGCPINLTVELLGDRWSLVVLRDVMFGNRRTYGALLSGSDEKISSNLLADRLKKLVDAGMLTRHDDPTHKQKAIFSLTEKSIALVPVFVHLGAWGRRWLPSTPQYSIRAQLLEEGGPEMWSRFMDDLRCEHLGTRRKRKGMTVVEELQAAFEALGE